MILNQPIMILSQPIMILNQPIMILNQPIMILNQPIMILNPANAYAFPSMNVKVYSEHLISNTQNEKKIAV